MEQLVSERQNTVAPSPDQTITQAYKKIIYFLNACVIVVYFKILF